MPPPHNGHTLRLKWKYAGEDGWHYTKAVWGEGCRTVQAFCLSVAERIGLLTVQGCMSLSVCCCHDGVDEYPADIMQWGLADIEAYRDRHGIGKRPVLGIQIHGTSDTQQVQTPHTPSSLTWDTFFRLYTRRLEAERKWLPGRRMVNRERDLVAYAADMVYQLLAIPTGDDIPMYSVPGAVGVRGSGKTEFTHQALYVLFSDATLVERVVDSVTEKLKGVCIGSSDGQLPDTARRLTTCLLYLLLSGRYVLTEYSKCFELSPEQYMDTRACYQLMGRDCLSVEERSHPVCTTSTLSLLQRSLAAYPGTPVLDAVDNNPFITRICPRGVDSDVLTLLCGSLSVSGTVTDATVLSVLSDVCQACGCAPRTVLPAVVVVDEVTVGDEALYRYMHQRIGSKLCVYAVAGLSQRGIGQSMEVQRLRLIPYILPPITDRRHLSTLLQTTHYTLGHSHFEDGINLSSLMTQTDFNAGVRYLLQCEGNPRVIVAAMTEFYDNVHMETEERSGREGTYEWTVPCINTAGASDDMCMDSVLSGIALCGLPLTDTTEIRTECDEVHTLQTLVREGVMASPLYVGESASTASGYSVIVLPVDAPRPDTHEDPFSPLNGVVEVSLKECFSAYLGDIQYARPVQTSDETGLCCVETGCDSDPVTPKWALACTFVVTALERMRCSQFISDPSASDGQVSLTHVFGVPQLSNQECALIGQTAIPEHHSLFDSVQRVTYDRVYGQKGHAAYVVTPPFGSDTVSPYGFSHTLRILARPLFANVLHPEGYMGEPSAPSSVLEGHDGQAVVCLNTPSALGPSWTMHDAVGAIYGDIVSDTNSHTLMMQYLSMVLIDPTPTLIVTICITPLDSSAVPDSSDHWLQLDSVDMRHYHILQELDDTVCSRKVAAAVRALLSDHQQRERLLSVTHVVMGPEAYGPVLGGVV
ncbi:hypothetical protein KIPB_003033 [Kipferlia bialata]|uniref:Uncharacterized protein n=1 Tax=Kipferlia bialata TaxID=797122 RepID=A0A391NKF7_9EUKA|nr:hypothetical protein KIPB_003033 [Kipferlia bialata]|eukprot:g3033.t1